MNKYKTFTTQLSNKDFETMENLRIALDMKRSEFIRYLIVMFVLAYPNKNKEEEGPG